MSLLSKIFGGATAGGLQGAANAAETVVGLFKTTDKERLAQFQADSERLKAQTDINKQEAAHKSVFVAGWRPFIGWVCGFAMTYHFIVLPVFGPIVEAYTQIQMRDLAWQELSVVLMGMLGLGGLRTYEKGKGVSREK